MIWYVVAAAVLVVSAVVGVLAGRFLAGKVSPSGIHVPSCCPPEGENT